MPRSDRNKRDLQATSSGATVLLPVSVTGNPLFSAVGEAGRHVLAIADACGGGSVASADGDNGSAVAGKGSSSSSQSARDK